MLIHIPHSSTKIPKGYDFPKGEITKMTDWYVDELFDFAHATKVVFPYTRLFCDVERFIDDPMEEKGMGICYTKKSNGKPLMDRPQGEVEMIIKNHYLPHHRKLRKAVEKEIDRWGRALIIDAHSFPKEPLPYEDDTLRPDICIGICENTPLDLWEYAIDHFTDLGYEVAVNRPFAGSIVPKEYMGDKRVWSMMIEVNRGLYLAGRNKTDNFVQVKLDIEDFLMCLLKRDK